MLWRELTVSVMPSPFLDFSGSFRYGCWAPDRSEADCEDVSAEVTVSEEEYPVPVDKFDQGLA